MTQVLPLGTLACLSAVQTLLEFGDDQSEQLQQSLVASLQTDRFTAVSEQILRRLTRDYPQRLTNQLLLILAPPSMRELSLAKCSSVTALGIERVLKRCRKLDSLDMSECDHLMHPLVFRMWQNLTSNVTSVCLESTAATDAIVQVILSSMPRLLHLNLSMCHDISDDAFLPDPADPPTSDGLALTSVDLSGCRALTDTAVRHLTTRCGPSLTMVNISWTEMSFVALVYLAGYTVPTALLLDDMAPLQQQLTELIDEMQEASCSTTNATPHPHRLQEASCCACNPTPHTHRHCLKHDASQVHSTVGCRTADEKCPPANVCQTEATQCLAKGNANESGMPSGEWSNSDVCKFPSDVDNCTEKPPEVVFKAECVEYLTFVYRVDGVVSEANISRGTPPSPMADRENVSSASDIASTGSLVECCCIRQVTRSYESRLTQIDSKGINDVSNPSMTRLCLRLFFLATGHSVQRLALSWKRLDDTTLQFIASHTPNLRTVSLTDCNTLTKVGIVNLCHLCQHLQHVNLQGVCFIGDGALVAPSLHTVSLAETDITDVTLRHIADTCSRELKVLDVSWCEEVTTEGMNAVAEKCVRLEKLAARQGAVTEQTLTLLAQHCEGLRVLNISGVTSVTDSSLVMLSLRLKHLEELDVGWNCSLSDVGVHLILRHCCHLKSLVLSGIKVLTSEPFLHIISGLPRWRKCQALLHFKLLERDALQQSGSEQLSSDEEYDAAYLPMRSTRYAPSLRWLDLEYCDKINDAHMTEVVAVCRGTLKVRDYYGEDVRPAWITP